MKGAATGRFTTGLLGLIFVPLPHFVFPFFCKLGPI
jgi:hypothetical protein